MRSKYSVIIIMSALIFIAVMLFPSTDSLDATKYDSAENTNQLPQTIYSAYDDKAYFWAGEEMPSTFDAKERLDRELSVNAYWQSNTLLNIKKANRYFPVIESILLEEGVPDDFKYLAVAESDLRNVTSSANAKGFWQFRKLAAKEFGLEVNDEVDERYHLERATRAAAKYLKQLRSRFGSWTNAAAAYNVGPTNFSRLRKQQGEFSYYDLNINSETMRYVFRLIAIKEIISQPENYGFYVQPYDKYPPLDNYYEVVVDKSVNSWSDFAKEYNISYRTLKVYNPWLVDGKLTVKKNTYRIKIPR